ncbi:hypothetical protein CK222_23920 [Mesorhizobium sp. WSM3866]|uniref:hypothetical protein n=1 Tax=Mesorhizobium sp. WSM3866 TaxID=422271 RepID=UPI000BAEF513|nr:hypothetical protein [Mesorhizobium sp. WSM3866]PBB41202.1 hypothetical protein CK222_23920 [Mesorhizobium sp. WSM3866]
MAQFEHALSAGLGDDLTYEEILGQLSADEADTVISQFKGANPDTVSSLLTMLMVSRWPLSDEAWNWLFEIALNDEAESRRAVAFCTLTHLDPRRFGEALWARNWAWGAIWRGADPLWVFGADRGGQRGTV